MWLRSVILRCCQLSESWRTERHRPHMRELVTFFGLQFNAGASSLLAGASDLLGGERLGGPSTCGTSRCVLLHWLLQVQALATAIGKQTAKPTSVHVLATCVRPSAGALLSRGDAAPVRVLSPAPELEAAMKGLKRMQARRGLCKDWSSKKFLTLLKWQAVRLTKARLVASPSRM